MIMTACGTTRHSGESFVTASSLADLVAKSDVIITGTVDRQLGTRNLARNPSDLAQEDQNYIVIGQDYAVTVTANLKGQTPRQLTVTLARGRGDRTHGTKDDADFTPLSVGAEYALFLRRLPYDSSVLALAIEPSRFRLGTQAVAESPAQGIAKIFPVQDRAQFLSTLRSATGAK